MSIVDFHSHFYPPAYLEALRQGESAVQVTDDAADNPVLHYPGDFNVAVLAHRDVGYREEVLARHGVDLQVLTLTTPGTHVEAPARAVALAQLVNDALATIVRARPHRFAALATLPLNDVPAAIDELYRSVQHLGFRGAMLFSNVNGVSLADPAFWPLYQAADQLEAVLYVHPTSPASVEAMRDYWLAPLMGFVFDTSLAAAGLVFSGVLERFPRIRWVLAHLGGVLPYVAERLDRGFEAFPECRRHIARPPSAYLRQCYYDTVNFDPGALRLAIEFAGSGRLLAGSDYPHQIGSLDRMLASLRALELPEPELSQILGGNARRLLGLTAE